MPRIDWAVFAAFVSSPVLLWALKRVAILWDVKQAKRQSLEDRANEQTTKRLELALRTGREDSERAQEFAHQWTQYQYLSGLLWEYVTVLRRQLLREGFEPEPLPHQLMDLASSLAGAAKPPSSSSG